MIITNQPFFDACYVYEAGCSNFQFNNRSTNCALGRDVITNDDIYACTQNNLPKARFSTISKSNNRVAEEAAPALTLTATVTVSTVLVTTNIKQSNDKKINERYNTGTKSLNATMIWNSKPSSIGFTFTVIRVTIYWMDLLVVNGYNLFKIMLRVRPSATNLLK